MPTDAERLRVVLDTNVLVSGLNFSGTPSRLLRLLLLGDMDWYISPFILTELARVLGEKFGWGRGEIGRAIRLIREVATVVDPPPSVSVIKEKEDDNRILECAEHVHARFLISGDKQHILPLRTFRGTSIFSPAEFMRRIFSQPDS